MSELVTVWDGSHQGCNRDLLCVDLSAAERPTGLLGNWNGPPRHSAEPLRRQLLTLLASRERWDVTELQRMTGRDGVAVNAALCTLKRQGHVRGLRRGVVQLLRGET